jgi:hypothetical protein
MSKINRKTTLTAAVLAALMLAAPAAFAVTVTNASTSTLPVSVANLDVKDATTAVALDALNINVSNTDLIIGRTTGFSVRLDLQNGATFNTLVDPTIGSALPGATSGWTVSKAAGGGSTDSYVVYSVQPGTGSTGVINGTALSWGANAIKVANVAGLATVGGTAAVKVTFADPNTAQQILTPVTQSLLTSVDPLKYSVTAPTAVAKIDVGVANSHASKTYFSSTGALNVADQGFFDAGKLSFGVNTARDVTGAAFAWVNAATSPDGVKVVLTGTFSAFAQTGASVYMTPSGGTCAASAPTGSVTGTLNTAGTSVTFNTTMDKFATTNSSELCFVVPSGNTTTIDASSVASSVTVTRTATSKTSTASADASAMKYNGPVSMVYTFNPGGNTTQQSFLRISNTGSTGGLVTITGKDDSGAAAKGSVSLNLTAGRSVQLTSDDLQNGNTAKGLTGSLGAGTGKWILTVTGQISGMQVTNLNRNNNSGTVSNLGTPVSGDH